MLKSGANLLDSSSSRRRFSRRPSSQQTQTQPQSPTASDAPPPFSPIMDASSASSTSMSARLAGMTSRHATSPTATATKATTSPPTSPSSNNNNNKRRKSKHVWFGFPDDSEKVRVEVHAIEPKRPSMIASLFYNARDILQFKDEKFEEEAAEQRAEKERLEALKREEKEAHKAQRKAKIAARRAARSTTGSGSTKKQQEQQDDSSCIKKDQLEDAEKKDDENTREHNQQQENLPSIPTPSEASPLNNGLLQDDSLPELVQPITNNTTTLMAGVSKGIIIQDSIQMTLDKNIKTNNNAAGTAACTTSLEAWNDKNDSMTNAEMELFSPLPATLEPNTETDDETKNAATGTSNDVDACEDEHTRDDMKLAENTQTTTTATATATAIDVVILSKNDNTQKVTTTTRNDTIDQDKEPTISRQTNNHLSSVDDKTPTTTTDPTTLLSSTTQMPPATSLPVERLLPELLTSDNDNDDNDNDGNGNDSPGLPSLPSTSASEHSPDSSTQQQQPSASPQQISPLSASSSNSNERRSSSSWLVSSFRRPSEEERQLIKEQKAAKKAARKAKRQARGNAKKKHKHATAQSSKSSSGHHHDKLHHHHHHHHHRQGDQPSAMLPTLMEQDNEDSQAVVFEDDSHYNSDNDEVSSRQSSVESEQPRRSSSFSRMMKSLTGRSIRTQDNKTNRDKTSTKDKGDNKHRGHKKNKKADGKQPKGYNWSQHKDQEQTAERNTYDWQQHQTAPEDAKEEEDVGHDSNKKSSPPIASFLENQQSKPAATDNDQDHDQQSLSDATSSVLSELDHPRRTSSLLRIAEKFTYLRKAEHDLDEKHKRRKKRKPRTQKDDVALGGAATSGPSKEPGYDWGQHQKQENSIIKNEGKQEVKRDKPLRRTSSFIERLWMSAVKGRGRKQDVKEPKTQQREREGRLNRSGQSDDSDPNMLRDDSVSQSGDTGAAFTGPLSQLVAMDYGSPDDVSNEEFVNEPKSPGEKFTGPLHDLVEMDSSSRRHQK